MSNKNLASQVAMTPLKLSFRFVIILTGLVGVFVSLYCYLPCPESILACLRAADSSILSLGMPLATALAMPPSSSI